MAVPMLKAPHAPVDPRDARRARGWLDRRGLFAVPVSRLLVARLRVRDRVGYAFLVACVALAVPLVFLLGALRPRAGVDPGSPGQVRLTVGSSALVLALLATRWGSVRLVWRGDVRLTATVQRRVTRTVPVSWRALVGVRHLVLGAVMFGVALLEGVVMLFAPDRVARAGPLVFLAFLVAFGALSAALAVRFRYRPVFAYDPGSLLVDDALRTDDLRSVLCSPAPLMFAPAMLGLAATPFQVINSAVLLAAVVILYGQPPRRVPLPLVPPAPVAVSPAWPVAAGRDAEGRSANSPGTRSPAT